MTYALNSNHHGTYRMEIEMDGRRTVGGSSSASSHQSLKAEESRPKAEATVAIVHVLQLRVADDDAQDNAKEGRKRQKQKIKVAIAIAAVEGAKVSAVV